MGETIEGCCHGGENFSRVEFGFCHKLEVSPPSPPDNASSSFVEHHRNAFQIKNINEKNEK